MTTLSLRTATDVLAAVPYLFGFHPTESLVVLAIANRRLVVQVRVDLPPPRHLDQVVDQLTAATVRHAATRSIIIGYGLEQSTAGPLRALQAALLAAGVQVLDALRVHDGRYWRLERGSPPAGTVLDASTTEVAAHATYTGLVALPDRAALVRGLAPLPGDGLVTQLAAAERRLVAECGAGRRRRRVAARAAVRDALERAADPLPDADVAWLAVLVADPFARDDAWQRMLAAGPVPEHTALWRDVSRRVAGPYVPAPATLLSLSAWRLGDGITALVAAERARTVDPRYALANLIIQALQAGIPPSALEEPPLSGPRPTRRPRAARRCTR